MLNKKGFIITPVIFIVFILIAVVFSLYISEIDADLAQGIQKSAIVEKGITDIFKQQIAQENYVKLAAYDCSKSNCYSSGNESIIESCIETELDEEYQANHWTVEISNDSSNYYAYFNISSFNATNINMSSDRVYTGALLHKALFKIC